MYNYSDNYNYNYMERINQQKMNRLARTKQVRKQKQYIIIGLFITILIISFFSMRAFVYANERVSTSETSGKQFKSVVIYCGDTIDSIAEEYFDYHYSSVNSFEKEIRIINHLSFNDTLIPGNYITVPYYK